MSPAELTPLMLDRGRAGSRLVLLRHAPTLWNAEGRWSGWADPPLSAEGVGVATRAGRQLVGAGLDVDTVFTSCAQRAIRTAELVLAVGPEPPPPLRCEWRLNERHFGALQGLDRAAAVERYGRKAVRAWRHDHDAVPPALVPADPRHPVHDPQYRDVRPELLPGAESMAQVTTRVLSCWHARIRHALRPGTTVLVVAHCHSLRVLLAHLDGIPAAELGGLPVPTGNPLVRWVADANPCCPAGATVHAAPAPAA